MTTEKILQPSSEHYSSNGKEQDIATRTGVKNILVTGAPGWLGNRLMEEFHQGVNGDGAAFPNSSVRCIVGPGADPALVEKMGAQPFTGDITKPETLQEAVEGVDVVFHLAGIIHPRKHTRELFAVNTQGTKSLLEASAAAGVRRFVYVSSNSVGGTNITREKLMTEADSPRPYLSYGRSKYLAERMVQDYHDRDLLETVVIRPCWYYGPNQPVRQTRFFNMIKSGRPLVFGNGQNLRSMSYIDNVVMGLTLAAKSENANGQTYWIADERPYPTIEIYETTARLLGVKNFNPRFVPGVVPNMLGVADKLIQSVGLYQMEVHVAGEMNKDIACSVEKAKAEIGYCPKVALEEGMARSIEWCRNNGIDI